MSTVVSGNVDSFVAQPGRMAEKEGLIVEPSEDYEYAAHANATRMRETQC